MEAFFVANGARRLFCVYQRAAVRPARRRVLVVPPFAEEMNKCRRLLAQTARQLAAAGCDVLIGDLAGTGDSEGQFDACDWRDWCGDLAVLEQALAERAPDAPAAYLAVRTGALLLAEVAGEQGVSTGARIVLWQPVFDGERYLQQFLRLRAVADRMAGGGESVAELGRQLAAGTTVEVAGYALSPGLAAGLAASRARPAPFAGAESIEVLECRSGAAPGTALTAPSATFVDGINASGGRAGGQVLDAEQFWTTAEISAPAAVVSATCAAFA